MEPPPPPPRLLLTDAPDDAARQAIGATLQAFNDAQAGPSHARPLAVLILGEDGAVRGGLVGRTGRGWLHVENLGLAEADRGAGLGRRLLAMAETEARGRGCIGSWLSTFSFQARGFYEKQGYTCFGTIADYPPGHASHFMSKRFATDRG